jgi:hypothetical protein
MGTMMPTKVVAPVSSSTSGTSQIITDTVRSASLWNERMNLSLTYPSPTFWYAG